MAIGIREAVRKSAMVFRLKLQVEKKLQFSGILEHDSIFLIDRALPTNPSRHCRLTARQVHQGNKAPWRPMIG
jgi:hypothetical protein